MALPRGFVKISPDALVRLCSLAGGYLVGAMAVTSFDGGIASPD
jgi:hypothetical protein